MSDELNKKKQNNKLPHAEPPYELLDLNFTNVKKWTAGIPAVYHSVLSLIKQKTVTRGGKALFKMNQFDGFDCPSCAWPDPDDDRSPLAEYCENGAKALAEEATSKKITTEFFKENSVYDLSLLSDYALGHLGRLAEPMYLPSGGTHYQAISWDDAFKKIATHLNGLNSPDEAAFYTSGRLSNEASFVYQLFVREFGTNNFPDCSNMCHETSGFALSQVLGVGKGTVKLDDFYEADVIIEVGHNPGTNAPRMLSALGKAKQNGAKIIAVNPLPEAGLMGFRNPQQLNAVLGKPIRLTDLYLPVCINGDMALFKALLKYLFEFEKKSPGQVFDLDFIKNKTVGFEALEKQLAEHSIDDLAEASGVKKELIYQAAEMIAYKKRIIICWGMGLTQQQNGVDMIKEMLNVLLLKGSIGIAGGGACPVRGHSNVQGNRTMLINNHPTEVQLDKLKEVFGFEPPRQQGYDVVNSIKAMHEGKLKVFFAMGGNFLSATPDTAYTADGMRKLDLSVQVSTKLNRSHLVHGKEALILPTLARSDKDIVNGKLQHVSTENSMGIVQWSRGVLNPVSDKLVNENQIACRLAMATLGSKSVIDWQLFHDSYDAVRDAIEKVVPGFENYNERVVQKGGFYLPNAAREGVFKTAKFGDKAPFSLTDLPNNRLADDEFLMATTRSHDQFNTTIYGLNDRYRGIHNERRVVLMNQKDIAKLGLQVGDLVDLFNFDDGKERIAPLFKIVDYPVPEKNAVTYFPETNVLVSINNTVKGSNMPASKYVKIKIKKHNTEIYRRIEALKIR
ncbi:MAG: FdhF/YdeP family oxidoreductase [Chitinophagales bacterium]|nr:FdhF/YdeP family oxidoreductase [Bacteroidota bacterium]MCB9042783.1 FdhF/YdeP family oxidoreductase [Chitinophagales bacterium]